MQLIHIWPGRSERNLAVVPIEFKLKYSEQAAYLYRNTFITWLECCQLVRRKPARFVAVYFSRHAIGHRISDIFLTLHGGAVGSIAEIVAIACARTVVNKDKELFLGELSVSYLAAAVSQAEVIIDASVVRSGRNLTVVAIEFKLKYTERLTYMCRATFYNMPVASL